MACSGVGLQQMPRTLRTAVQGMGRVATPGSESPSAETERHTREVAHRSRRALSFRPQPDEDLREEHKGERGVGAMQLDTHADGRDGHQTGEENTDHEGEAPVPDNESGCVVHGIADAEIWGLDATILNIRSYSPTIGLNCGYYCIYIRQY